MSQRVTRAILQHARYLRTTPTLRVHGQRVALSRLYHASSICRDEGTKQSLPPDTTDSSPRHLEQDQQSVKATATEQLTEAPTSAAEKSMETPESVLEEAALSSQSASEQEQQQPHSPERPSDKPQGHSVQDQRERKRIVKHVVSTFDPAKLKHEDFVQLSGRTCTLRTSEEAEGLPILYQFAPKSRQHEPLPFPHGTHGFFYLARAHGVPPIASELRFRITHGISPRSFELGRDLNLPYGIPWAVPVMSMLRRVQWKYVLEKLEEEGLIPKELKARYNKVIAPLEKEGDPDRVGRVLHAFRQPFVYHFGDMAPRTVWLIGEKKLSRLEMATVFNPESLVEHNSLVDKDGKKLKLVLPNSGSALLCFEKAPENHVVLRCLRVLRTLRYPATGTESESTPDGEGSSSVLLRMFTGGRVLVNGKMLTLPISSAALCY